MSLKEPDDEYDELITEKTFLPKNFLKKQKKLIPALIIGIILGVILYHYIISPITTSFSSNDCISIKNTNQLLNIENDCLYSLLGENARTASEKCGTKNIFQKNNN